MYVSAVQILSIMQKNRHAFPGKGRGLWASSCLCSHPSGKPPALPPFSAEWRRCKSYSPYFHTRYKVQFLGHRQKEGGSFFWLGPVNARTNTALPPQHPQNLASCQIRTTAAHSKNSPPPSPKFLLRFIFAPFCGKGGGAPPPRNIN